VAAEVTLSYRLFEEMKELKRDFKETVERGKIDQIIDGAKEHGYLLRKEKSLSVLNEMFNEKMNALQESRGSDLSRRLDHAGAEQVGAEQVEAEQVEEVIRLLDLAKKWDFEISLWEAQNLLGQILEECFENLEKCWWEDGTTQPFPPNLITLAEKLGFNVERFCKMISPTPAKGQSLKNQS